MCTWQGKERKGKIRWAKEGVKVRGRTRGEENGDSIMYFILFRIMESDENRIRDLECSSRFPLIHVFFRILY